MATASSRPELLVIVGETASGKSGLALKLAKKLDAEIISADSWQVYKGFSIGTAKPSTEARKQVKHYLIDIAEPEDGFSAPLFKKRANQAIREIQHKDKLPIIVGGTGLYIDSLIFDYSFLPVVSRGERQKLSKKTIAQLIDEAKKQQIDLSGIDLRNKRRIIRALEARGQKPQKKSLRPNTLIVGLRIPRGQLREKVETRVNGMFKNGLEAEARELSNRYSWHIEPMKGIGYREFQDYFEDRQSLEQTKKRIVSATMSLAKRQRTWFKRHKFIQWFDSPEAAFLSVIKTLNN